MASIGTYWTRIKDHFKYYAHGVYRVMNDRPVFLWAQAIAFKVLVTIVPIVLLATGVLGQILRGDQAFESVASYVRVFVPYQSEQLIGLLQQLQKAGTAFTVVGILGLLYSAMTLFTTLRIVVANLFQEEWHEKRSILKGYVFDVRMAAQVGLVFLLSFGLSLGMQALNVAGAQAIERLGFSYVWVQQSWSGFFYLFGLLLPLLLSVGMFFQLFFFVPKPHPPKRSALLGALVTGFLWEGAKYAFTLYASHAGRFSRYQVAPGSDSTAVLTTAFGLVIAFVFWIYYSGVVLCIGGAFSSLNERRLRVKRKQKQVEKTQQAGEHGRAEAERTGIAAHEAVSTQRRQKAREDVSVG
ncbi:MAG TPA: YihY/virulence factor BrkB family protein [Rhodothermales bacterium]|nr:YihY/virulence factor BrkB family protein [Rhodothermales bacterium]